VWDYDILGLMYDTPGYLNPYDLSTWQPDLLSNWTVGTWTDAGGHVKSMVTMTFRPDLYFSDGQPLTIADVKYSMLDMGAALMAGGMAPPWWWPIAETVQSFTIVDPYTVQILFNTRSVWAEGWALGGFYILPEHIWKPLIHAATTPPYSVNIAGFSPDANLIGSGPWRLKSFDGLSTVVMVANKPGSTVTASPLPSIVGVAITSPEGYHNYCPVYANVHTSGPGFVDSFGTLNDGPYATKINLPNPSVNQVLVNFSVVLANKWLNSSGAFTDLDVNKTVYVDGVMISNTPGLVLPAATGGWPGLTYEEEDFSHSFTTGLHYIEVVVNVTSPLTLNAGTYGGPYPNQWLGQIIKEVQYIWVSAKEDIAGSSFFNDWSNSTMHAPLSGYVYKAELPTPDFRVGAALVGAGDISRASFAFGSYPGSSRWDSVCDYNNNKRIDGTDIAFIAKKFGWPPWGWPPTAPPLPVDP